MHDVWYGSSTVDSDYCGNYFGSAGTAAEKNPLYNYHCTAVCVWVGPGSLHGTDDAFCGCGAEPAACVTVQNNRSCNIGSLPGTCTSDKAFNKETE